MKKALLYSAMVLGTAAMTTSCGDDFLVIEPAGAVSETTLSNDQGIDYLLTGAYSSMYGMMGQWDNPGRSLSNCIYGDIIGGDANEGSQAGDQPDWNALEIYSINAANPYLREKWQAVYEAVRRCNNIMKIVEGAEGKIANADVIVGQAQFIKALWLFEGIKVFGAAIPYVSLEDYKASVDPQVSNVDESGNYVYIWNKVEADLQDAIAKLPETWDADFGRATKWQAKALLGKLYLYWSSPYNGTNGTDASKLSLAKSTLEDVMNNGKDAKGQKYKLASTYEELFRAATSDWNGESIIDVQLTLDGSSIFTNAINGGYYTGFAGGTSPYPAGWAFYQPSCNYVNSMMTDPTTGLPIEDFESKGATTNSDGVTDLSITTDPRLDIIVGRCGVPFLDWGAAPSTSWIRQVANGGLYLNKKNHTTFAERGSNSLTNFAMSNTKNWHVMRLADLKLMLAEIAIRENQLDVAKGYINEVRARAAKSYVKAEDGITKGTYTMTDKANGVSASDAAANYCIGIYGDFASADAAWKALKRERRAELGMEGQRWFDLARWGEVGPVLNNFVKFEKQYLGKYVNNYNENWITMPIPLTEIQTAEGRFVQNVNWK